MSHIKIQKMAQGGEVKSLQELEDGFAQRGLKNIIQNGSPDMPGFAQGMSQAAPTPEVKPWDNLGQNFNATIPAANSEPAASMPQVQAPTQNAGVQQQLQGINQQAQVEGELGRKQAELADQKAMQQQQLMDHTMQLQDEIRQEIRATTNDIKNGMIDPNRYVNNMTSGAKVSTSIGLLLGGFGSSITGQENPAMKFLNQQIENDLKAQQANQNTKENLFKFNMQQFGNETDAANATRAMYADIYASKLEAEAGRLKDPMAKAQAMQKAGELRAPYEAKLAETAQRQALIAAARSPGANPQMKDQAINQIISALPEAQQKDLRESKEVYDNTKAAFTAIDDAFQLVKDTGVIGANMPFTKSKAQLETEHAKIESAIRATMKGQGTIQESEIVRLVNPFLPQGGDTPAQQEIKKRELKNLLATKNSGQIGRLKNAGIPLDELNVKKTEIKKGK